MIRFYIQLKGKTGEWFDASRVAYTNKKQAIASMNYMLNHEYAGYSLRIIERLTPPQL